MAMKLTLNKKRLSIAIALALFAGNAAATSVEDKIEL